MRYGRKRTYRRKYRRRYGGTRRFGLSSKVKRVVRRMAEVKTNSSPFNFNVKDTKSIVSFFDGITTGTSAVNRIGNNIKAKRWSFRMEMFLTVGTGGSSTAQGRVAVIFPRKGFSDFATSTSIPLMTFYQYFDPSAYVVLYDKVFNLGAPGITNGGQLPTLKHIQVSRPFWGELNYGNSNIYREPLLVLMSNLDSSNTSSVSMIGYTRASFIDI